MRKADPRGDLGRVERQREMLAAVAKKAASPATVLNPVRYWKFNMATAPMRQARPGHSLPEALSLASPCSGYPVGRTHTHRAGVQYGCANTGRLGGALGPNKAKAMFSAIARGDTSGLAKYAK